MKPENNYIDLCLSDIIKNKQIITHFQPIVSFRRKKSMAYEALSRAIHPITKQEIQPIVLFSLPKNNQERQLLDCACQNTAITNFANFYKNNKEILLTINFDAACIGHNFSEIDKFIDTVRKFAIKPSSIIIEIIESEANDELLLLDFVKHIKKHGFIVALDDFGTGHSNLNRIEKIHPHLIKLDRSLVSNIHKERYKFEVTRSIVKMSEKLGVTVLGEGVERESEVVALLELGVELFQGFRFGRPKVIEAAQPKCNETINSITKTFRKHITNKIMERRIESKEQRKILRTLILFLIEIEVADFNVILADFIEKNNGIESLYILDSSGIQLSDTITRLDTVGTNLISLYMPASAGEDHSLKDFILPLHSGLKFYHSDPYISLASGNTCNTMSRKFRTRKNEKYILCMDIKI
ncbi:MAG: EAL domain-containing protein [Desulfotalea sp.]